MNDQYAKEIEAALNHELKSDLPNAKLNFQHPKPKAAPPTSRERLGTAIAEIEACVSEAQALVEALKMLQARL